MAGLREALEDAVNKTEAASPEVGEAPETQSAEVVAPDTDIAAASAVDVSEDAAVEAPAVDAEGAKAPAEAKPVEAKPDEQETAAQKAIHRVDRAPQSWKKEAKGEWNALPLHVRQEVYRREGQVNQAMQEAAQSKEIASAFQNAVAPYQARLQSLGGAIPAVQRLLQAETMLATGTRTEVANYMAQLIKDYDVDIAMLDNVLSGQQQAPQQQSPDISSLVQQQVQQALAPLIQERQQKQQQSYQAVVSTVEDMSLDPKYPHFDQLREDMADIVDMKAKRGIAISLPEAYAIAAQMNSEVASQMQRQATMNTAAQQHQQAQRAKLAASSVTGSPAGGGSQVVVGDGSLRGAIEAAFGGQRL